MLRSRENFGRGGENAPSAPRTSRSPARKSPPRAFPPRRGHGTLRGPFPAAPWWKAAWQPSTSPHSPSQGGGPASGLREARARDSLPNPTARFARTWNEAPNGGKPANPALPKPRRGRIVSRLLVSCFLSNERTRFQDHADCPRAAPLPIMRGGDENRIRPAKTFHLIADFHVFRFFTMV